MSSPAQTTIFERMSALARETGAINLGQGFPDREHAPELLAAAQRALVEHSNQYPPMRGLAELRRAVADYYARDAGAGGRPRASDRRRRARPKRWPRAILAFVKPGDEAILFQPAYDAYRPLVERAGGTVQAGQPACRPSGRCRSTNSRPRSGRSTRVVLLNTPNNPTGTLIDRATLEAARRDLRAARPRS